MRRLIIVLLLVIFSCSKEENITSYLDSFAANTYFEEEVFSDNYLGFYGLWKALGSWGGWSGYSEPTFDFLEIKPYGIYGIIKNNILVEYGNISPNNITPSFPGLPVIINPQYSTGEITVFRSNMYFELVRPDTLSIADGLIDGRQFIFSRIKNKT